MVNKYKKMIEEATPEERKTLMRAWLNVAGEDAEPLRQILIKCGRLNG